VERVLFRTTIIGDVPVGVDGFRSQSLQGEVFGSAPPEAIKPLIRARSAEPETVPA
jgi:taurine dioxygenase